MTCPACSSTRTAETAKCGVHTCLTCEALFGSLWLGDSYSLVGPSFHKGESRPEDERYFDLECIGSSGVTRRHGWFNIHSRAITQVG